MMIFRYFCALPAFTSVIFASLITVFCDKPISAMSNPRNIQQARAAQQRAQQLAQQRAQQQQQVPQQVQQQQQAAQQLAQQQAAQQAQLLAQQQAQQRAQQLAQQQAAQQLAQQQAAQQAQLLAQQQAQQRAQQLVQQQDAQRNQRDNELRNLQFGLQQIAAVPANILNVDDAVEWILNNAQPIQQPVPQVIAQPQPQPFVQPQPIGAQPQPIGFQPIPQQQVSPLAVQLSGMGYSDEQIAALPQRNLELDEAIEFLVNREQEKELEQRARIVQERNETLIAMGYSPVQLATLGDEMLLEDAAAYLGEAPVLQTLPASSAASVAVATAARLQAQNIQAVQNPAIIRNEIETEIRDITQKLRDLIEGFKFQNNILRGDNYYNDIITVCASGSFDPRTDRIPDNLTGRLNRILNQKYNEQRQNLDNILDGDKHKCFNLIVIALCSYARSQFDLSQIPTKLSGLKKKADRFLFSKHLDSRISNVQQENLNLLRDYIELQQKISSFKSNVAKAFNKVSVWLPKPATSFSFSNVNRNLIKNKQAIFNNANEIKALIDGLNNRGVDAFCSKELKVTFLNEPAVDLTGVANNFISTLVQSFTQAYFFQDDEKTIRLPGLILRQLDPPTFANQQRDLVALEAFGKIMSIGLFQNIPMGLPMSFVAWSGIFKTLPKDDMSDFWSWLKYVYFADSSTHKNIITTLEKLEQSYRNSTKPTEKDKARAAYIKHMADIEFLDEDELDANVIQSIQNKEDLFKIIIFPQVKECILGKKNTNELGFDAMRKGFFAGRQNITDQQKIQGKGFFETLINVHYPHMSTNDDILNMDYAELKTIFDNALDRNNFNNRLALMFDFIDWLDAEDFFIEYAKSEIDPELIRLNLTYTGDQGGTVEDAAVIQGFKDAVNKFLTDNKSNEQDSPEKAKEKQRRLGNFVSMFTGTTGYDGRSLVLDFLANLNGGVGESSHFCFSKLEISVSFYRQRRANQGNAYVNETAQTIAESWTAAGGMNAF